MCAGLPGQASPFSIVPLRVLPATPPVLHHPLGASHIWLKGMAFLDLEAFCGGLDDFWVVQGEQVPALGKRCGECTPLREVASSCCLPGSECPRERHTGVHVGSVCHGAWPVEDGVIHTGQARGAA